ncbi:hypothetical protein LAZ67_20000641 [Cordylochernes scorpioides]|uniref:CCHC-type domain-containing protein n=1 Tax=Cordylochernes scorpioides TaxID=51811 RepID=A0ABY6LJL7_9ARAC|nr:hypothetical protein LAZ67_20000641 [Cordylochernes scorpioides]
MLEEEIRQTQLNGTTNTEQAFLGNPERKNLPSTSKPKPKGFPFSCHFCGKKGHKAADCRKRMSRNPKNEMVASFGTKYLSKLGANEWCLDNGATAHMCSSRDSFDHFEETAPVKITLANGGFIEALGKGKAYERNGLYILSQINCRKALATREICIAGEKNYEKWHSRFGHLNLQDLKKLKMQNIVYGLPNFDVKNFTCEVCLKELSRIRNEVIEIDASPQKDPFVKEIPLVEEKGSTSELKSRTEIESESDLEKSDLVDEPSESEVVISIRGRGRPRYIRTGKPGRPRKEYPTANLSTQELLEAKYLPDPKDAEEALSGRDSYFWKKAMEEEFDSLIENKTWELVDPPKNRNIIGTKWVFKTKCNSDGSVERHKARLVAKGYSQQYGIDYEETFAPVVRQSTIRMFLALAVEYNLIVHQMDVQSAYLNGEIKEEVYMAHSQRTLYQENIQRRIQTEKDGSISIDQEKYIEELLAKYRMKEAKPISTPMDSNSKLTKISSIEVSTRPDIAYAVSALGQFSNDPRRQHWNAAKRVLRYLKGTSCLRITYRKSNEALHGYVDADWGGNLVDRKSHTGIVYFLARGPIAWESKKQETVTLSSTESEYIALCEAGKEAVYLRALLDEMGFGELLNGPTVLKTDNQGAQQLARNPVYHARTKHIDIKWHFIRSICSDGLVEVVHTPTQENVADILTKGLPRFKAGRISIEDDPRQGRPTFQRTDENVQKITDLIKENPRTTLLELEQDTGISKTTIGRIVTEDLRLKKTPAKFIPRFLTNEQKLCRLATCEDMLEMTRTDPEWKDKIITGDETWVYLPSGEVRVSLDPKNPDIAPNEFFLFPKLKAVLKGRHFDTREDIIEKSLLALKSILKEAYKNCFDNWEKRWRWCVEAREDYFEKF